MKGSCPRKRGDTGECRHVAVAVYSVVLRNHTVGDKSLVESLKGNEGCYILCKSCCGTGPAHDSYKV